MSIAALVCNFVLSIPKLEPTKLDFHLMPYHRLCPLTVPITSRLQGVENLAHLLFLALRQLHIPRREVLFQTMRLSRTRDRDHALGHDPSQSNLGQSATLAMGQSLDLLDDLFVIVEVLALELGDFEGSSVSV
jgi:hypothetical protein